jgi:DegV family protein with EDD domain
LNPEKIAFLVDSCADLQPEHLSGRPIYVVPLRISCADGDFSDGEDINNEDVYRRQEAGELPRTSLPDMVRVAAALDQIRADGYEKVIALPLSSGLSGTHNLLRLCCEARKDLETAVFETLSGSLGIGVVVLQLWEDIQAGMTWAELTGHRVRSLFENTHPYFSVDTLEYLEKGGRIGKVTALAGSLLSIKPILTFADNGELVNVAKVRGRKHVQEKLIELTKAWLGDHKRYNLAVANGGDPEGMEELKEALLAAIPGCQHIWSARMDATLATYVGRGMLGAGIQILD